MDRDEPNCAMGKTTVLKGNNVVLSVHIISWALALQDLHDDYLCPNTEETRTETVILCVMCKLALSANFVKLAVLMKPKQLRALLFSFKK